MEIRLDDKVAVVTGGSRGIGAATVKLFAECGAHVIFSYRQSAQAAAAVVESSPGRRERVTALRSEVSKMADARRLIGAAVRRFGRLDLLVANAGIWPAAPAPFERMTESTWNEMMAINLKGVFAVIRQALPHMIERKSGRIIVVSSTAGQRGEAFHADYAASKGALISLVKSLAAELATHRILVNCVAPGWVDTDMSKPVLNARVEARRIKAGIPLRRAGRPEDLVWCN